MRSIEDIQAEIIAQKEAQSALNGLTSTSKVSEWRLWTYIIAVCTWTLEQLFLQHQADIESTLLQKLPHTLNWYKNKALAYQHGQNLRSGSDEYDNTTLSDEVIAERKIITRASAIEHTDDNNLSTVDIKVAKGNTTLQALTPAELNAFSAYMFAIKDAGVRLRCFSYDADKLNLTAKVYYDSLLLNIDGTLVSDAITKPVEVALNNYLARLPFDGRIDTMNIITVIGAATGVKLAEVAGAWLQVGNTTPVAIVGAKEINAGYLILGTLNITYEQYI